MDIEQLKKIAGERAAERVNDGMVVGLGTGSTVKYTILKLGERVRAGLDIVGIPTSESTARLAKQVGIKLAALEDYDAIDLTIDGADEVDSNFNLIKGGGGALLREKMIAYYSKYELIVVDERKVKEVLGVFPLPIEIVKFGHKRTMRRLADFGCIPALRHVDNGAFITDNGNYIVDCKFSEIKEPSELEHTLNMVPGVVENGLFIGLANEVIIGTKKGVKTLKRMI